MRFVCGLRGGDAGQFHPELRPHKHGQTGTVESDLVVIAVRVGDPAVSPILTLFAEEWFYAARSTASALPSRRHSPPVCGVLDELRWLVPLPSLPAIAARDRAAGIGLIYAVQTMRQEVELYRVTLW